MFTLIYPPPFRHDHHLQRTLQSRRLFVASSALIPSKQLLKLELEMPTLFRANITIIGIVILHVLVSKWFYIHTPSPVFPQTLCAGKIWKPPKAKYETILASIGLILYFSKLFEFTVFIYKFIRLQFASWASLALFAAFWYETYK